MCWYKNEFQHLNLTNVLFLWFSYLIQVRVVFWEVFSWKSFLTMHCRVTYPQKKKSIVEQITVIFLTHPSLLLQYMHKASCSSLNYALKLSFLFPLLALFALYFVWIYQEECKTFSLPPDIISTSLHRVVAMGAFYTFWFRLSINKKKRAY